MERELRSIFAYGALAQRNEVATQRNRTAGLK